VNTGSYETPNEPDPSATQGEESAHDKQVTHRPNQAGSAIDPRVAVPVVLDVPQAARLLGIGRTLAYELVRTDQWPTPVIRVGRLIKIPSGPLLELITTGATRGRRAAG